jgi:hypothetical protein
MSVSGQSGNGKIELKTDLYANDLAVSGTGVPGSGINNVGDFKLVGDLAETDCGLVPISKANGWARITGTDENGYGAALASEVAFSPVLNGTLVLEARVELQALTARNVFVGFAGTIADNVLEPLTAATVTITKVVPALGFLLDSQLTAGTKWHMPYLLATDTTQASTVVVSSQTAVAAESDILRLEVDPNGAARWYINGVLEQSVGAGLAATPTTLLGALCGTWGTTTTVSDLDCDYLMVSANRDWTR